MPLPVWCHSQPWSHFQGSWTFSEGDPGMKYLMMISCSSSWSTIDQHDRHEFPPILYDSMKTPSEHSTCKTEIVLPLKDELLWGWHCWIIPVYYPLPNREQDLGVTTCCTDLFAMVYARLCYDVWTCCCMHPTVLSFMPPDTYQCAFQQGTCTSWELSKCASQCCLNSPPGGRWRTRMLTSKCASWVPCNIHRPNHLPTSHNR